MKKKLKLAALVMLVVVVAIQLVPVDRSNPPATASLEAPPEVMAILKRSCFDCHSHETVWPWYSYVAPVSWLIAADVVHGREEMNFSTWDDYTLRDQEHYLEEIVEEVEKGAMPLPKYLKLHPDAAVSAAELAILRAWAGSGDGADGHDEHDGHDHSGHRH